MVKKIFITGSEGFIARNLSEHLNGQYSVSACNSKELNLLDSPEVFNYLKSNRFDVIIHTATHDVASKHSAKDPSKVLENNLKMFFGIARCKDYFGKMIYFGSGAEFSRPNWIPKMKEDYFDQHLPVDQYGFSKYLMTKYAQSNSSIYNLRLFGVFGKYDDWQTRFIPNVCSQAVLNKPIIINQNRSFDFLYVDDLVKIVKWFIENQPKQRVYNVCSGKVADFKTIVEKIIKISGKKLDVIVKIKGLGVEYSGDNSLLLSELGGFKFSLISESIKALYDWYDLNKELIFKEKIDL